MVWYEASVVQLYAEAFDASFDDVIRLCSGFGFHDDDSAAAGIELAAEAAAQQGGGGGGDEGGVDAEPPPGAAAAVAAAAAAAAGVGGGGKTGETFESLEEWAMRHTALHDESLSRLERRRDLLVGQLSTLEEEAAAALEAAGGYNPFDQLVGRPSPGGISSSSKT